MMFSWKFQTSLLQRFHVVLALLVPLVLTNCGEGGKARYEFSALNEEQVLDQFAKAKTPEARASVISRIRAGGITPEFSFGALWSNPRAVEMCQSLDADSMRLLLGTHDQSCKKRDFFQFVELILACDNHYDFIIGEVRRCNTSLPPRLIFRIADRLEDGGVPEAIVKGLQENAGVALMEDNPNDDPLVQLNGRALPGDPGFMAAMERRDRMIAAGQIPGDRNRQYAPEGKAWEVPARITLICNEFAAGLDEESLAEWEEQVCALERREVHQIRRELFRRGETEAFAEFRRMRIACRQP